MHHYTRFNLFQMDSRRYCVLGNWRTFSGTDGHRVMPLVFPGRINPYCVVDFALPLVIIGFMRVDDSVWVLPSFGRYSWTRSKASVGPKSGCKRRQPILDGSRQTADLHRICQFGLWRGRNQGQLKVWWVTYSLRKQLSSTAHAQRICKQLCSATILMRGAQPLKTVR